MGLDNIVMIYNSEQEEYDNKIPKNISIKFESVIDSNLIGLGNNFSSEYNFISFSGKAYSWAVSTITDGKYNLYQDLKPNELEQIYLCFERFLSDIGEFYQDEITKIQCAYDNTMIVDNWISYFIDNYIPSPKEIKGLKELFRICYENNLSLYASY